MKSGGYVPSSEGEIVIWLVNFQEMIAVHGPGLNLGAAEMSEIGADIDYYLWILRVWTPAVVVFTQDAAEYRLDLAKRKGTGPARRPELAVFTDIPPSRPAGLLERIFLFVKRIKCAPGYNEEVIGKALRILRGPSPAPSAREYPAFKLAWEQGPLHKFVLIIFMKHGHHGVVIESRINGGPWEFLAVDNRKPHRDERPLLRPGVPETREYRLRWWDKGTANGVWSPAQSISVTG